MRVLFGKRERLVAGGIAGILTVAILHIIAFAPNARNYVDAKNRYQQVENKVREIGSFKSEMEIQLYDKDTEKYKNEYNTIIEELMLGAPKTTDYKKDILDSLKGVVKLVEDSNAKGTTRMAFLGENGWDIPNSLPPEFSQNKNLILDILDKLESNKILIETIKNQDLKQRKEFEYYQLLRQLGIDVIKVNDKQRFPDPLPLYKLLMHAELIKKSLPPGNDYPMEKLYNLLQLKFYTDSELVTRTKQLLYIEDVLKMAVADNISQIDVVILNNKVDIPVSQPASDKPGQAAASPIQPIAFGAPQPGSIPPVGFAPNSPNAPQPDINKPVEIGANGFSFIINFQATNLDGMKFLYNLTHSHRTYEIDALSIKGTEEGNINVSCSIGAVFYISGTLYL